MPYIIALAAVIAGAWAWHGITEHHWHLRALRLLSPGTAVPVPRHDTRWHGMGHGGRAAVQLALIAAAMAAGAAWQRSPRVTVITLAAVALAVIAAAAARALSRSLGSRRPEHWEED